MLPHNFQLQALSRTPAGTSAEACPALRIKAWLLHATKWNLGMYILYVCIYLIAGGVYVL